MLKQVQHGNLFMRILLFSYEFFPVGGEEEIILYRLLQEYVNNNDLQIDLITTSSDEKQHLLKIGGNISIYKIPIVKKPKYIDFQSLDAKLQYIRKACKFSINLAKENSYNFTHAFSVFPCGIVSFFLAKKLRLPYVISLRESDIEEHNRKYPIWHRSISSKIKDAWDNAYFIIANDQTFADLAMETHPGKEVKVIHKGVDVHEFLPDTTKINPNYFTIICVAHIVPQKGVRFLIQAFEIISSRFSQTRLVIVGDGTELISLQELVQGFGLKDKIFFTSAVSHEKVIEYYQKSDVFVLPLLEGEISDAMSEAIACGLPIITTDTKTNRDILEENINCLMVKTRDVDDLVEKIEKLILNRDLGRELGKNNKELAKQFTWEVIANKYFDTYLKIRK